ncbi:MAG: WD40 repeat domain-containing protein, partial [Deltaproteobacteria bacterium]|nr:WD40 repeat domain-containing protein [Deltaproteobacteria bacterium]
FAGLEERRQLVRHFLRQFLKELDEQHLEALIQADGAENPLFLKVVLTELRVFGAFGQLGEVIRREFGTTPQSAFEAVLRRLESDPSYAAVPSHQAVSLLFGLLAHSRGGLPEDLLARMFLAELGLAEERLADMEATIQLFLRQVRPFLARREGRVDFFYESFQLAARKRYEGEGAAQRLAAAWHGQLARACDIWRALTGVSRRYALGNLVQHHVAAGHADQAAEALTEFAYHYERLKALGREDVVDLAADFVLVDGSAGLAPAVRGRLGTWKAFHAENAHLLRRDVSQLASQTHLLQFAVAHADTSPVTESAESWLENVGSEAHWLRSLSRPHQRERSACLRTLEGHTSWVRAVALLPDGKCAVSGSYDKKLKLWDIETGKCLRTFDGHTGSVTAVALLPDGKRALSGSWDKTLRLWDIETGRCLRTLQGHTAEVVAVAALLGGECAISGSYDKTLKLWDLENGRCLRTLDGHGHVVEAVATLPDGKRAISGSQDCTLKVWDLESGKCLRTLQGHKFFVMTVASTAAGLSDGIRILSGSYDMTLRLWDLETGQCLRTLKGHMGGVDSVVPLPDGKRVLSGSSDKTLKLWDLETGQCLRTLQGHTDLVRAVAPLPDGKRALSGSSDNTLKLWDLESGQCLPERHTSCVNAVAPLPDGKRALSGSRDKTLKLWDLETGQCLCTLEGHADSVEAIVPLPDGKSALSRGLDNTLKLWDLESGQCQRTTKWHAREMKAVVLLPDGKRALSGSRNKTLKLWDLETGQCLRNLEGHRNLVRAVALLPDGKRALSGSFQTLRLWDLETGQCLRTLQGHRDYVTAVALLPDGKRALSGSRDKTLKLWDLESGLCLRSLEGHTHHVAVVAPLSDGKRAISGAWDWDRGEKTLKVWDLDTGQCLHTLEGHTYLLRAVALLPDGKRAISGSWDKTLKLWNLETGRCLATWQAAGGVDCLAAGPEVIVAGTRAGEVLFLKPMPPGRIVPETIAATWHPSRPLLAIACANGTLLLQAWHPESQFLEELVRTNGSSIASVQWSADGAHLLAAASDGTTHILDATTLQPVSASGAWVPPRDVSPDGRWRAVIRDGRLEIVPVTA